LSSLVLAAFPAYRHEVLILANLAYETWLSTGSVG
jgi:hypothetical protein